MEGVDGGCGWEGSVEESAAVITGKTKRTKNVYFSSMGKELVVFFLIIKFFRQQNHIITL